MHHNANNFLAYSLFFMVVKNQGLLGKVPLILTLFLVLRGPMETWVDVPDLLRQTQIILRLILGLGLMLNVMWLYVVIPLQVFICSVNVKTLSLLSSSSLRFGLLVPGFYITVGVV